MRVALLVLLFVALLSAAAAVAVGWIFADRILVPAPYALMPEFRILGVGDGEDGAVRVVLPAQAEGASQFSRTEVEGRYGLLWPDGAGRLGAVVERDEEGVVRPLHVTGGEVPAPGDPARIDVTLFGPDPSSRGLAFEHVSVPGPQGSIPAWWLPGTGDEAILVLHGRRRADRTEALRILPTLEQSGASVLVATYRNHDDAPPSPDGFYHYGATEVVDALASVAWLEERGVRRLAVYGFSMGGAIAVQLAGRVPSSQAPEAEGLRLVGLVLDAPLVDPVAVFRHTARQEGIPLPNVTTAVATRIASLRAGIDWRELDARRIAPRLHLPVLVIAGTRDGTVPIELVDDFVAELGWPAEYLRLEGVEHVEGWNAAPHRYEEAVERFLRRVLPPPARTVPSARAARVVRSVRSRGRLSRDPRRA